MKQTYNQPTIELVEVTIEQGIAQSVQVSGFSLNDAEVEDVKW